MKPRMKPSSSPTNPTDFGGSDDAAKDHAHAHATPPSSPTSDVELRVRNATDQSCWSTFVTSALLALSLFVVLIWSQWRQGAGAVQTHSLEYFVLCMVGGVLSGLPHFLLTPFDQIKCRMQTGEFANAVDGFKHIWNDGGDARPVSARVAQLYRGWAPTLIGYSLQGAGKFGLYEYFKWAIKEWVGADFARGHSVLLFLIASATAEVCADVLLAPWEAIKVKIQTNPALSGQMSYTMTKFATFEKAVELTYVYIIRAPKSLVSPPTQLAVSLFSGFAAGFFCTIVSHPADTVISKLNQKAGATAMQIVHEVGCAGLWKGILTRIMFIGTLTALQWLIYDSFKVLVGLQTTGGGGAAASATALDHRAAAAAVRGGHH